LLRRSSQGENEGVEGFLPEGQIGLRAVDVPVAQGVLRGDEVMPGALIDALGEGLAHGVGAHLAGEFVRGHRLVQDAPGLDRANGPVRPLPTAEHEALWGKSRHPA
jgi:hypothetical protein